MSAIRFELDGRFVELDVEPLESLRAALHDRAGVRSLAEACGVGACGACSVLIDGRAMVSCVVPAVSAEGRAVTTIEGFPEDDPVVAAFIDETAFQCGACTPGFIAAVHELRRLGVDAADDAAIRAGLSGDLCRCGSHPAIMRAARAALGPAAGGRTDG